MGFEKNEKYMGEPSTNSLAVCPPADSCYDDDDDDDVQ